MAEGTQLAERGKEKISAGAVIELVKKLVKDRYNADKAQSDRALAEAENYAGGRATQLDKDVLEQGRRWAARLAMISRQTAGNGYQASKGSAAISGSVKKIFAVIGELEAMLATDAEVSLFQKLDKDDYYGNSYGRGTLQALKASDLAKIGEPGDELDADAIRESIIELVGERVENDVVALLDQYEIEPIVVPEEPESASKSGRKSPK